MLGRSTPLAQSLLRNVASRRWASTKVHSDIVSCPSHASNLDQTLRETFQEVIPAKQEQLKKLVSPLSYIYDTPVCLPPFQKAEHSQAVVGEVKVVSHPTTTFTVDSCVW